MLIIEDFSATVIYWFNHLMLGQEKLSRGIVSGIMLATILLGTLSSIFALTPYSARTQETHGPRHNKGLEIYFYENSSLAFEALRIGEIDLLQWSLTYEQYQEVIIDPTLLLAGYHGGGIMEFDLNNNYSISDFPGVRNPLNEVTFRRALAHMVDKDWIIREVLKNFGERIDAPISAAIMGYANESVIGENYPYPYNLTRAAELLDIYFADTDEDGMRNYPVGWPGREAGPNLDPIKTCIRSDHGQRLRAGRALADNMRALDIPVNQIEAPSDVIVPQVMYDFIYHIYTGGWSVSVGPPMYLYGLFHSSNWIRGGSNYVTGMNSSNLPNYPDLDVVLEDVYYATSIEGFRAAVKEATGLLVADYCVNIPLWSYKYWMAYRMNIVGIVNSEGSLDNTYTFLNAYKVDDPATPQDESQEPITMGTVHAPEKLNILYSSWYYDYAVLDRIFDSLFSVNPYDLSVDQPWIAQDWESSTWYDPQDNKTKTKLTYWIRKDVFWHAPVTGEEVRQFTAHDVEFTIWYGYSWLDDAYSWVWRALDDIHHTNVVDDFTIEVCFDFQSIWAPYWIGPNIPLLPRNEYLDLLCGASSATFYSDGTNCTASTRFMFTDEQVVQIISADVDGAPLVEGVDFEIFVKGDTHNEIHFLTDLPEGTVAINYYTPTVDPHGYYLGGLDWTQAFYSLGPYYLVEIQKGVGGWAIFECNPSHFLSAPPLGEIDWKWTWVGTEKPRSGYYQVNLFDAVRLLKAYCSRGAGIPSQNWFPGADIDPTDMGHVGLYDAVTILGKYGTKWGIPPP